MRAPWWTDLADGLRAKWRVRLDRWWTLVGAVMMLSLLPATGVLLPLRVQGLGLSAGWFGACSAALSVGVLAGVAGVAPRLVDRLGRVRALALAIVGCGVAMAGVGLASLGVALVALFAAIGLCLSVTQWVGQTHRLLAMPAAYRARMAAAHLTVSHAVAAVAPGIAGGLLLLAVPGFGHFLRQDHQAVVGWYARCHPEAFRRR